ncbi:MAG: M20 family metallopeptidase [bacterium]
MIGAKKLRERLEPRREDMTEELRQVVSIDSPTFPGTGTTMVASHFEERYRALGGEVERIPGSNETGDHLTVRFRGKRPEGPTLFLIGHCDTVFPEGTAAKRPFTVEGDTGRGPGVVDMKGGLVTCFYAMEALLGEGFDDFGTIVILYDTDEERGNPSSRPLIEEIGKSASAALILEPGRADGSIVSARMGSHYGNLTVNGIAAHAGVDPDRGRSAVQEMAEQIVRIYNLARIGGTINVTGLAGGERPHIIAENASCFVEIRAWQQKTLDVMRDEMTALIQKPVLDGTSLRFDPLGGRPAMERTPDTDKLLDLAREVTTEAGVEFSHTNTGGGSDGNYLAPYRVPILDGLGPVGGNLHTAEEYIELPSLVPRAAMLAGLIERCASGI